MSFEALRALITAAGYELRFRDNEWIECLMIRDGEAWLGRGRDRTTALHAAVHLACPSSLARELLNSRIDHLVSEAAAASAEHREKVLDAIANEAPATTPPFVDPMPTPARVPRAMPMSSGGSYATHRSSVYGNMGSGAYRPVSTASVDFSGSQRPLPVAVDGASSHRPIEGSGSHRPSSGAINVVPPNIDGASAMTSSIVSSSLPVSGVPSSDGYNAELAPLDSDAADIGIELAAQAGAPGFVAQGSAEGYAPIGPRGSSPYSSHNVTLPGMTSALGGTAVTATDAELRPYRSTPSTYERPRATPRAYNIPPPLVRREVSTPRVVDPPRALEELDILLERVRESRDELGLCSPERQRLAMLAWICEARAHTDTFPDDLRIRERVGAISRQLTEIGKTFWPGSVTALQLQMQPRDLPRHVLGGPAPNWSRAAELSERALHALEYSDERRGFDAYGWADIGHAYPLPENPTELLDSIIREVENCGGALPPHAAPRDGDARPDGAQYMRWVRSVRWLRSADVDPDRWGRLAGRLRWWATHRDVNLAVGTRELESSFAPERPWPQELGIPEPIDGQEHGMNGHAAHGLLDSVRDSTSGKRLVFVSNRRDPDLELRLKDLLPEAALEWRVAEPKRIETLGEAIQQGAFDVVLAAIGFQSLATDHLLARACRLARVKYLRVNRGRPTVCLRALARA